MDIEIKHPWWARFSVGILMLILAFIGMIITDVVSTGGWSYWKWTVPIYALSALWLSWYERKKKETISPITLWHEAFHWAALFLAFALIEVYVHMGLLSRFLASLVALTTLSLTVFTIGIYIDWSFVIIGVILGLFALIIAVAVKYLYVFAIPALLLSIIALWFFHRFKSAK